MELTKVFQKRPQWKDVAGVCKKIHAAGFKAWLAGGCVRDAILKLAPKDFDIATNAKPEEIEKLFEKTVAVGKSFGVIRVITKKGDVEVATFRKDGDYKDGRHPESVAFSEPEEDAKRRDFTINAVFYDVNTKTIHDFVGGLEDIKKKIIRTVGDPDKRFQEDKLRVLRAVRFVSQLGFKIDEATMRALKRNAHDIHQVSGERLFTEIGKLFSGKHFSQAMDAMEVSGLREEVFPSLHRDKKVWAATSKSKNAAMLRWFLVFEQMPNEQERQILWSRLKPSREFQSQIEGALKTFSELKKFKTLSMAEKKRLSAQPSMVLALDAAQILKINVPKAFIQKNRKLPKALVDANMLLKQGFTPGPAFGQILKDVFDAQLEGRIKNKKQALVFLENKR